MDDTAVDSSDLNVINPSLASCDHKYTNESCMGSFVWYHPVTVTSAWSPKLIFITFFLNHVATRLPLTVWGTSHSTPTARSLLGFVINLLKVPTGVFIEMLENFQQPVYLIPESRSYSLNSNHGNLRMRKTNVPALIMRMLLRKMFANVQS
jgi:hypothetical protein